VRTTIISPRTPRRSGKRSRAARAAAVDDEIRIAPRQVGHTEADRHVTRRQSFRQTRQSLAWIEMGLVGKEEPAPETAREIGLEAGEPIAVDPLETLRALGKACQVGGIAWWCHDEAALLDGAREVLLPPADRRCAEVRDGFVCRCTFAPGRQHATRHPGARALSQSRRAFDDFDGKSARAQFHRASEACDAGSNDRNC
jgi:hypothetical protein